MQVIIDLCSPVSRKNLNSKKNVLLFFFAVHKRRLQYIIRYYIISFVRRCVYINNNNVQNAAEYSIYYFLTIQKYIVAKMYIISKKKKDVNVMCVNNCFSFTFELFGIGASTYWCKVNVNNELERKTVQSLTLLYECRLYNWRYNIL